MWGIAPILCFVVLVLTYAASSSELGLVTRVRMAFIGAAVTWGLVVTAFTELLSPFHLITFAWLLAVWMMAVLISVAICITVNTKEKCTARLQLPSMSRFERSCLVAVLSVILLTGLVAFVAPPNNSDSMTYHMARVMHWIQNQTVAHYPTNILYQLFHTPWAEFAILHFQVLSGGDRWANLVQWFSMSGCVIGVSLIARQLGADARGQIFAALIAVTIPMGILQASSTQNDYVAAFWLVCTSYYIFSFKNQHAWANTFGVGASLALAILTKAVSYLYATPLMAWFIFTTLRCLRWQAWKRALVVGGIVLSVNLGHYTRNVELFGNPLGIGQAHTYANEIVTLRVIGSNILRNISLHLGTPSHSINTGIYRSISFIHNATGIDISDPRTTLYHSCCPFRIIGFSTHEDRAGNPIHLLIIVLSVALLCRYRQQWVRRDVTLYAALLTTAFVLFCIYLKWQSWNNRLHLPLFVLWSPVVSIVLLRRGGYKIAIPLMVFLIAGSTLYVFRNEIRPLVGVGPKSTVLNTSRIERLLLRHTGLRDHYPGATQFVQTLPCRDVGLVIGDYDLEYPFWTLLKNGTLERVRIEHINVTNASAPKSRVPPFIGFSPCAVIVVDADRTSLVVEKGNYTKAWALSHEQTYTQAWSSGPVRVFIKQRPSSNRISLLSVSDVSIGKRGGWPLNQCASCNG